jgi:hypothetical protein
MNKKIMRKLEALKAAARRKKNKKGRNTFCQLEGLFSFLPFFHYNFQRNQPALPTKEIFGTKTTPKSY